MTRFARALLLAVLAAMDCPPLPGATEKDAVARQAQIIVVGTFVPDPTVPWFDGWHINGAITIHEVLYGKSGPARIRYHFACRWKDRWKDRSAWWPPPSLPQPYLQRGLWFLRLSGESTWESSAGYPDPGFRPLSERADWERYIRTRK